MLLQAFGQEGEDSTSHNDENHNYINITYTTTHAPTTCCG